MKLITILKTLRESLANLDKTRRIMSVAGMKRHAKRAGVTITDVEAKLTMHHLEKCRYGRYIQGRHGHPCRFHFGGDIDYIRNVLGHEIDNTEDVTARAFVLSELVEELGKIVAKMKGALAQCEGSSSSAHVDPSTDGGVAVGEIGEVQVLPAQSSASCELCDLSPHLGRPRCLHRYAAFIPA